jgi:hypothetical protein
MGSDIQSQLAAIPTRNTLLRLDLQLYGEDSFEQAAHLIRNWVKRKTADFGLQFPVTNRDVRVADSSRFEAEIVELEQVLSASVDHIDVSKEDRRWITEMMLRKGEGAILFSLRLSVRQSRSDSVPAPRAPRVLGDLVATGSLRDFAVLTGKPINLEQSDYDDFRALLASAERRLPILAISRSENGLTEVDPERLATFAAGIAHVVVFDPGIAWEITKNLGKEYSTFHGAVRCYGFGHEGAYSHKLWLTESLRRMEAFRRGSAIDAILSHAFAFDSAQFEVQKTLLSPTEVRRIQDSETRSRLAEIAVPQDIEIRLATESATRIEEPLPIPETSEVQALQAQIEVLDERVRDQERQIREGVLLLQEARDEAAQTKQKLVDRDSIAQERDQLRQELSLLKGDVATLSGPVKNFWEGFSLFVQEAQNLIARQESLEIENAKVEHYKQDADTKSQEVFRLKGRAESAEAALKNANPQAKIGHTIFPQTWDAFLEAIRESYQYLKFSPDIEKHLQQETYTVALGSKIAERLSVLNSLAEYTDESTGAFTPEGLRLYQDQCVGRTGNFSDESDTNKRTRIDEMRFTDSEDPHQKLDCTWHGKIDLNNFRVHYEWPRPTGQRHVKIGYIGTKITKV